MTLPPTEPFTYSAAGVDLEAADEAVMRIKGHVASTYGPEVLSSVGGFGGCFAFDPSGYEHPVLVSTTDGVGTKSEVARLAGRYDTIGIDCVAMSVDDLAACGAEPLFFLDYISLGRNDPALVEALVSGVAAGCRTAGCSLVAGEISEHPGLMEPGHFDLVGFAVGVAERKRMLPAGVQAGDRVVGIASPGLRSNGYSLARAVLLGSAGVRNGAHAGGSERRSTSGAAGVRNAAHAGDSERRPPSDAAGPGSSTPGRRLDEPAWPGADRSLADELLVPSVIYSPAMTRLVRSGLGVRAFAHVTGGGIPGNLVRVLAEGTGAVVHRGSWPEPRIFAEIARAGNVADDEMARVFNLGLGMLAVVAPADADAVIAELAAAGHDAFLVGTVTDGAGVVMEPSV